MAKTIKADGEKWEVELSQERPHEGVTAVIFRCLTNSSFGWRVVEVPVSAYESKADVEGLGDADLRELFDRSQPFDYTHDPKAHPNAIGDTPRRR